MHLSTTGHISADSDNVNITDRTDLEVSVLDIQGEPGDWFSIHIKGTPAERIAFLDHLADVAAAASADLANRASVQVWS